MGKVDACLLSLSTFLQSQRERFPPLFNLNDKDLLGLLAIDNVEDINHGFHNYLKVLFPLNLREQMQLQ